MYLTGFADEAGASIDVQIKATKELGWENIESRAIDGTNIHDLPEKDFDVVVGKLNDAGVKINCFGSTVANWGKEITEPFDSSLEETKRAIPRMQKLGTKLIRIMSFAVLKDRGVDDQMEEERFRRLRELQKMYTDAGIMPVHENCMNYGGMGWTYTQKLVENVPGLKLVFDTGNPVQTPDYAKGEPYPMQSAWDFYDHVKDHIAYIHIKDGVWDTDEKKAMWCYPGEGQGDVVKIVDDMIAGGYDGGISIEPHMALVFHDKTVQSPEEVKYNTYVEYGKRMGKILQDAMKKCGRA